MIVHHSIVKIMGVVWHHRVTSRQDYFWRKRHLIEFYYVTRHHHPGLIICVQPVGVWNLVTNRDCQVIASKVKVLGLVEQEKWCSSVQDNAKVPRAKESQRVMDLRWLGPSRKLKEADPERIKSEGPRWWNETNGDDEKKSYEDDGKTWMKMIDSDASEVCCAFLG